MSQTFTIAQISDSHLFSDPAKFHHGANVYQNLLLVLIELSSFEQLDAIIFTGDLTQDHTSASYQLFAQCFEQAKINVPVYFLAGNHDEPELMHLYLGNKPFDKDKLINFDNWQVLLINSKSETPAGYVDDDELTRLVKNKAKFQLVMMHHHPVDVNYFIDRHGLNNQQAFWQAANTNPMIKAIACGHVHRSMKVNAEHFSSQVPVFTCPATSIEFDTTADTVASTGKGPGFRLFILHKNGELETACYFIETNK